MSEQEDSATAAQLLDGLGDEERALLVEIRGWLVEDGQSGWPEERACERDPRRSPAERGRPASPTTVSYPSGSARTKPSAPAGLAAAGSPRRGPLRGRGGCCRRRCRGRSSGAAEPTRALASRRPGRSVRGRRRPRSRARRLARRGPGEGSRWCSCRAGLSDEREGLARTKLEVERVEHEPAPAPDRRRRRARSGRSRSPARAEEAFRSP